MAGQARVSRRGGAKVVGSARGSPPGGGGRAHHALLAALPMSLLSALVAAAVFLLATLPMEAQDTSGCGSTRLVLEQDGKAIFELPRQAGQRLQLVPDQPFLIRYPGAPESGLAQLKLILPLGIELKQDYVFQKPALGAETLVTVPPEHLAMARALGQGLFKVELTLRSGGQVCQTKFEAQIPESVVSTPEPTATSTAVVVPTPEPRATATEVATPEQQPPAAATLTPPEVAGCGDTRLFLEQGGVVIFELPRQEGERLQLEPDQPFSLRISKGPPSGVAQFKLILPFGVEFTSDHSFRLPASGEETLIEVRPADLGVAAGLGGGLYKVELGFVSAEQVCQGSFDARMGEGVISSPVAAATAGAAAVGAAGAVASAGWSAAGAQTNLKLKVSLARRRRTGWKRWVPFPNWRRTAIGSVIGTITGVLLAVFFQQGGIEALTTYSLVRTAFLGAFSSFGLGMAWATALNYFKPPIAEGEKEPPPPLGLATVLKVLEKVGIKLPRPWKRKKP